ncbi:hypothetical protein JL108_06680 [Aeromicrobium sp. YIM 150415]|uniref:hypothetical protein n=1 Tax=Aeromicrobium sp. YIM 150415 TaxID=2803912 RepID=UPI0019646794|nr:hypothetical protein [Aeromicrobium sp. YIM 150415]MBM9463130.1 hypothetical protein [Aeromicrobium sp. YIM 150415]
MTGIRHRHIARASRTGMLLAVSGATAMAAAALLTVNPAKAYAEQASPTDVDGSSTVRVQVLTPRIEAGGTARFVVGVSAEGARPDGEVQLRIGDRVVTRELVVGTASVNVRLDEPGAVEVRARHLDDASSHARWSDATVIAVR